jgi:hypothetical protein
MTAVVDETRTLHRDHRRRRRRCGHGARRSRRTPPPLQEQITRATPACGGLDSSSRDTARMVRRSRRDRLGSRSRRTRSPSAVAEPGSVPHATPQRPAPRGGSCSALDRSFAASEHADAAKAHPDLWVLAEPGEAALHRAVTAAPATGRPIGGFEEVGPSSHGHARSLPPRRLSMCGSPLTMTCGCATRGRWRRPRSGCWSRVGTRWVHRPSKQPCAKRSRSRRRCRPRVSILIHLAWRSAVTVKPVPLRRTKRRWQPDRLARLVCVMEVEPDEARARLLWKALLVVRAST